MSVSSTKMKVPFFRAARRPPSKNILIFLLTFTFIAQNYTLNCGMQRKQWQIPKQSGGGMNGLLMQFDPTETFRRKTTQVLANEQNRTENFLTLYSSVNTSR